MQGMTGSVSRRSLLTPVVPTGSGNMGSLQPASHSTMASVGESLSAVMHDPDTIESHDSPRSLGPSHRSFLDNLGKDAKYGISEQAISKAEVADHGILVVEGLKLVGVGFAKTAMYAGLGIAAGALALAIGVRELGKCFRSAIRSHRLSKLAAPVPTTRAQKLLMDDLKKARDFNKKASIDSGIRAGVNIAAGSVSIAVFAAGVISGIGAALVPFVGFGIATGLKTFRTWELKNTDYLNDQKELADRMRDRIFDLKSRAIEGELVPDDRLLLKTLVAVRLIPKNAVPADFSDDASLKKLLLALNKIGDSDVNAKFAPSVEGLWHIHAPHGDGHGEESARLTSGSH